MKSFTVIALAILAVFAAVAADQQASISNLIPDFLIEGKCPTVDEKNLWDNQKPNHERFAGKWYEVAITSNPYQLVKECTHSYLSYNGNGFQHITMGLDAAGNLLRRDGVTFSFITGANVNTPHLSIQFEQPSWASPFVILDTDYESYACIYSCVDYNSAYVSDFGFIWSRVPDMHPIKYDQCKAAFAKISVDTERFQPVKQGDDCNYALIQSRLLSEPKYTKNEL